jgi:TRAP-type C4-dicarboxylate transport system permease small subunit
MREKFYSAFERSLEIIVAILLIAMVVVVVMGVGFRKFGDSLVWYDEIASILLAWLTYYGAALAALKRAHIGFPGLVDALPQRWRVTVILLAEALVITFFLLLAWVGFRVLQVLEGDTLVSLPEVSIQLTQSVIPIGALLFVAAQLLSLPEVLESARADRDGRPPSKPPRFEP